MGLLEGDVGERIIWAGAGGIRTNHGGTGLLRREFPLGLAFWFGVTRRRGYVFQAAGGTHSRKPAERGSRNAYAAGLVVEGVATWCRVMHEGEVFGFEGWGESTCSNTLSCWGDNWG